MVFKKMKPVDWWFCSPGPLWATCALEESMLSRGCWFLSAD